MASVLGNGTLAALGNSYYGAGGGAPTIPSTINVSTVATEFVNSVFLNNTSTASIAYLTVPGQANVVDNFYLGDVGDNTLIYGQNGILNLASDAGSSIKMSVGAGVTTVTPSGISTGVVQATLLNDMVAKTGKAPYLLGGGNFYVPAAGTTIPLAQFSTLINHVYQLEMPSVRIQNQPATAPAAVRGASS
jgi:hypothetical protein